MPGNSGEYSTDFKAKVALEALRGKLSDEELATKHDAPTELVIAWRESAARRMALLFEDGVGSAACVEMKPGRNEGSRLQPSSRDLTAAAFAERYIDVQYVFVQFLTEHLADCAKAFGGDLEKVLILAVIGQAHLSAVVQQADGGSSYGMSALRVADITGIPRENVRRKLVQLSERGWIERGRTGWRLKGPDPIAPQAKKDLNDLDRRGLERLGKLYTNLTRVLKAPPKPFP